MNFNFQFHVSNSRFAWIGFGINMHRLNYNEPSARAVDRFMRDAEIPGPAQRFGGIGEGVVLAVGKGHAGRPFTATVGD
jgi:hypothetical protein